MTEQWWICTDALARGGAKILGPFESQELALRGLKWEEPAVPQTRRARGMKIRPIFAWYDLWVGVFIDRTKRRMYVFPLPCIGLVVMW